MTMRRLLTNPLTRLDLDLQSFGRGAQELVLEPVDCPTPLGENVAEKREAGFAITFVAFAVLWVGATWGVVRALLQG